MLLREYKEDCPILADLFYNTVHFVNKKDYTKEQLNVWASGKIDLNAWNISFSQHYTIIAEIDNTIVGFGNMTYDGYLDRLYVHKDYQNQGIGTKICDTLEYKIKTKKYTTHASITTKPFFEKRGYKLVKEQQVNRQGIYLTNYVMEK